MKQFFKFMFASMLGFMLAFFIAGFIGAMIIAGIALSFKDSGEEKVKDNTVLEIKLDETIVERGREDPIDFDFSSFTAQNSLGLDEIIKYIDKASGDEHVKGLFLNLSNIEAGVATLEEIRHALELFKASGKFIYAYSEFYTQGSYYLASVADKIYVHPEGGLLFHGLTAQTLFLKGALEKLEIEPIVIRHGKFKSAVEPFILDKMSAESKEQTRSFVGSIWRTYLENIARSRKLDVTLLDSLADHLVIQNPEDAVKHKLADKTAYYDEVLSDLKKASGLQEKDKERFTELKKYVKTSASKGTLSKNKIAVIYAVGPIGGGEGNDETIGSERVSKAIRKARLDTSIKAIVLRVNSPGGSALASDVIWRETVLAKKEKPFVVSMGDVAASGGYYISCAADTIVAEPNTITGSIGVFGLLFNTQKLFNNKLGITFDTVKTGRYSDIGSGTRPMTNDERAIIQKQIERIYDRFTGIVADGRKIEKSWVDSIGQGRVWSGTDAKRIGLVDKLGGLDVAIAVAARMAKLETYRTVQLPEQKPFFEKLMEDFSTESSVSAIRRELGDHYSYYRDVKSLMDMHGVQARMPYRIEIY